MTDTRYIWDLSGTSDSDSVYVQIIAYDGYGGENSDINDYAFSLTSQESSVSPAIPGYSIHMLLIAVSLMGIGTIILIRKINK